MTNIVIVDKFETVFLVIYECCRNLTDYYNCVNIKIHAEYDNGTENMSRFVLAGQKKS